MTEEYMKAILYVEGDRPLDNDEEDRIDAWVEELYQREYERGETVEGDIYAYEPRSPKAGARFVVVSQWERWEAHVKTGTVGRDWFTLADRLCRAHGYKTVGRGEWAPAPGGFGESVYSHDVDITLRRL